MASSATGVVRKQGKAEGSPWPRGMVGLVSASLRFSIIIIRIPLIDILEAMLTTSLALNPHIFFDDPFSISLSLPEFGVVLRLLGTGRRLCFSQGVVVESERLNIM